MKISKQFAPEYERNEQGWIKFPSDSAYRKGMFPEEVNKHPAKANVYLVQSIIEYISEPGQLLLDPMAGTGTLMVGALVGRYIACADISELFYKIMLEAREQLEDIAPGAGGYISILNLPCQQLLLIPNFADHIIFSPQYCLHPDTKILKSDLTWIKASELIVGEELIGFDEDSKGKGRGAGRKMKASIVEAIKPTIEEAYLICLSNEDYIIASRNHRWLTVQDSPTSSSHWLRWRTTSSLQTGSKLKFLARPWKTDMSHDGGYLQGVFDGEGWVHRQTVGFGQNEGETLDNVTRLMEDRGYHLSGRETQGTYRLYLERFQDSLRFLGSIRPNRLLKSSKQIWENKEIRSRIEDATEVEVTSVIELPEQELLHIQTSTGTFIANGLMSHNSGIMKSKGTDSWNKDTGYAFEEYSKSPLNLGTMSDFVWGHEMELIYKKCYDTLKPNGTMTLIVKDHMEKGRRVQLVQKAIDASIRAGFSHNPEEHFKWAAPGMPYTSARRARGIETVDDESIVVLRKGG